MASFARARRLARYNWSLYAIMGALFVGGLAVASQPPVPITLRWLSAAVAAGAAWFGAASFLAFHWMFDCSELLRWTWLREEVGEVPRRWIEISVALEETTAPLHDIFPGTEGRILDIYDPEATPAPAIAQARQQRVAASATVAPLGELPVPDAWADAAFVILAAHEIRDRERRERFFLELARVLHNGGRLVLVEHLRNLAAALAFGPGLFHFLPRSEWMRLAARSGLRLERERSITPFVHVLVYSRAGSS